MANIREALQRKAASIRASREAERESRRRTNELLAYNAALRRDALIYGSSADFKLDEDFNVVMSVDPKTVIGNPGRREFLQKLRTKSPDYLEDIAELVVKHEKLSADELPTSEPQQVNLKEELHHIGNNLNVQNEEPTIPEPRNERLQAFDVYEKDSEPVRETLVDDDPLLHGIYISLPHQVVQERESRNR